MITDAVSLEEVQELVRRGEVDVKETDCNGNNILHKVCSFDTERSEVVEYLVSIGAPVNQVNRAAKTSLIVCADKGYLSTLRVLLNNGACVDPHGAVKQGHDSAILAAAKSSHEECVRELIKHNADIWYKNKNGENLLLIACMKGLTDTVTYCVQHDVVIEGFGEKYEQILGDQSETCSQLDMHGPSAFFHAVKNGRTECWRILSDNGVNYKNIRGRYKDNLASSSPILSTAVEKQARVMEWISCSFALSYEHSCEENLLMLAAANGLVEVVKECLDRFDEVEILESDSEGRTVIMHACANKQYACLKELLSCGKFSSEHINKVSKNGFTALMLCAKEGFLEGIKLLIDYESDINRISRAVDRYGNGDSILLLAAQAKHEKCVRELLNHRADQWFTNDEGKNLLMIACEQGLVDIVKHCMSHGTFAQITAMDNEGNNALYLAYKNNQTKCMKVLLAKDKNRNDVLLIGKKISSTHTSLVHKVCEENIERPDIVELFVTRSTMIDALDSNGRTPLMVCAGKCYLETLKVLIKHGASLDLVQGIPRDQTNYTGDDPRDTSLLIAAKEQHLECVLSLIESGANIWHVNNRGESLLFLAASAGWTSCVELCLNMYDSRNGSAFGKNMNKALILAIKNRHETCALEIISRVADIGFVNAEGQNPLMLAAQKGLMNVVRRCIDRATFTDLHQKDKLGRNALMIALLHGHFDCAGEIPGWTTLLTGNDWTLILQNAVHGNKIALLHILTRKGFIINRDIVSDYLLQTCADGGDVDMLNALVALGADVNLSEKSLVLRAAQSGHENLVLELISMGADWVAIPSEETLLMIAAEHGMHKIVKMCLEKGTESYINRVDHSQHNAVWYACENHQTACLEEILKSGKCHPTKAAIKKCKSVGYVQGIKLLRRYILADDDSAEQADVVIPTTTHSDSLSDLPSMTNSNGQHILYLAESGAYSGQGIIDMIVQGKEDIWVANTKGQNLLMIAARKGLVDIVKYCVSGATFQNLHATDQEGKTAIMHACSQASLCDGSQNLQCLAEILKSDAVFSKRDTGSKNKFRDIDAKIYDSGKSLMQMVCNGNNDMAEVAELLVERVPL